MSTICAIATAKGISALSIVRVSGEEVPSIFEKIFLKNISEIIPKKIYKSFLYEPETKEIIDEITFIYYKAPDSYTGEDMLEIISHGGYIVPKLIEEAIIKAGAVPASPGEFTKRRFLNGKIDLFQAESINEISRATTKSAVMIALNKLKGEVSKEFKEIQEEIIDLVKDFEVIIDFPEEDVPPLNKEEVIKKYNYIIEKLSEFINEGERGKKFLMGPRVAICGKVNVGKSTLFNAILKKERAIVSEIPGTTRDYILEEIFIKDFLIKIYDTAGIRKAKGKVEKIGIIKTEEIIKESDIIIYVVDASKKDGDFEFIKNLKNKEVIVVFNKIDKGIKFSEEEIKKNLEGLPYLFISAKEGKNIDKLRNMIEEKTLKIFENPSFSLNEREEKICLKVLNLVKESFNNFKNSLSEEIVVLPLRESLSLMNELIGVDVEDKILEKIFENFCIGK
ncbi:MAG: tRNA uridine-5-carboxymethylaminomethyl(34) synthesis GTPase MnmE [candidate division WOR-3 bacterium]